MNPCEICVHASLTVNELRCTIDDDIRKVICPNYLDYEILRSGLEAEAFEKQDFIKEEEMEI